jgi:hypothetical protein
MNALRIALFVGLWLGGCTPIDEQATARAALGETYEKRLRRFTSSFPDHPNTMSQQPWPTSLAAP